MATLEKEIQNQILSFLRSIGVHCWQVYNGSVYDSVKKTYRKSRSPYYVRGVSDILGILDGRFLAIEVKSEKGRLTDEQRVFLRRINDEGGVGIVGRSVKQVALELAKHFPEEIKIRRYLQ